MAQQIKHIKGQDLTPAKIEKLSEKTARKYYSHLRYVANKRIGALERSGYFKGKRKPSFPALTNMPAYTDVYTFLPDLARFIRSGPSVSKIKAEKKRRREATMRTFGISGKKADQMGEYFDRLRELYTENMFDSGTAMDVWEDMASLNVDPQSLLKMQTDELQDVFEQWVDNAAAIARSKNKIIEKLKGKKKVSAQDVLNALKAVQEES